MMSRCLRLVALLLVAGLLLSGLALAGLVPAALAASAAARELGGSADPLGRLLARPPTRSVIRAADGSVLAVLHGDQDRVVAAKRQPLRPRVRPEPHRFPYFVDAVTRALLGDHALDGALGPAGSAARRRAVLEGGLRVTTTLRPADQRLADGGFPPGSSFKVFYRVAALEEGIPPSTSFDTASPVTVTAPACPTGYTVHNAEPASAGRLDLARATARSVNTYYAQLMARITGPSGRVLFDGRPACRRVLDPRVAATAVGILRGVVGPGGTGFRAAIGRPLAGKTGTTSGFADAWFTGFTPQLATSVWVGDPRAQVPMRHLFGGGPVYGGTFPALIFHDYMAAALQGPRRGAP